VNFSLNTKNFAPCQTDISALVICDVRRVRRPLFGLSRIDSRSTGIEYSSQVPSTLCGRYRVESSAESVHYSPLNSRPSRSPRPLGALVFRFRFAESSHLRHAPPTASARIPRSGIFALAFLHLADAIPSLDVLGLGPNVKARIQ
jgi:hypothetical protein